MIGCGADRIDDEKSKTVNNIELAEKKQHNQPPQQLLKSSIVLSKKTLKERKSHMEDPSHSSNKINVAFILETMESSRTIPSTF